MTINNNLKLNLITDVKNTLDISLTKEEQIALERAFEITIGIYLHAHGFYNSTPVRNANESHWNISNPQIKENTFPINISNIKP